MITDARELGTILSVCAHPDDEGWLMSGILATAARNGQRVASITATRGEQGVQDASKWSVETLGQAREQEMMDALHILGIKEHYWLGCPDGGCDSVDQSAAIQRVAEIIKNIQPNSIMTFGPEGLTGHPDHCCVSRWAGEALKLSGVKAKLYYYRLADGWIEKHKARFDAYNFFALDNPASCPMDEMSVAVKLEPETLKLKLDALAAHHSQYDGILEHVADDLPESHATETFCEAKL